MLCQKNPTPANSPASEVLLNQPPKPLPAAATESLVDGQGSGKVFVPIPGLEGRYSASRCGSIWSHITNRQIKPYIDTRGYPTCSIQNGSVLLSKVSYHTLIALTFHGPRPDGFEVDHINRNRADPRAENLRYVSRSDNTQNSGRHENRGSIKPSRFKGVIWRGHRKNAIKPWTASLRFHSKRIYLKYFATEEEAARAYDAKVMELRGPGACTNESLGYFK